MSDQIKDPMATMKAKLDSLVSGLLSGGKAKLFTNNVTISETTVAWARDY